MLQVVNVSRTEEVTKLQQDLILLPSLEHAVFVKSCLHKAWKASHDHERISFIIRNMSQYNIKYMTSLTNVIFIALALAVTLHFVFTISDCKLQTCTARLMGIR